MQVNDELRVLVEAEVGRAIENFKKLSGGIEDSEEKSQSLGEALDSLSKKSLLVSGVLGGAGIAAVKLAGENEKLKLSLKNMLGSAEEASLVFEEWRRLGNSPGLSSSEVFELGRAMVNMGHDSEYATGTMRMLGDVAAGTGKSFGAVSGAFEHVRAAGKLTTRDLAGLQQQGIPIVKQMAKELNTSEEGVRSLAAEGKIGFTDLERAFRSMAGPGGQFSGMMDELSGTVLEKFSTASSEAKQALASFGETMLPMATELLDSAASILQGITNMDEGTRRFALGMGGVVAASGPAITAIKGVSAAMAAAAANPYMLAIGGAIAAAGVLAGVVYKQAHAYEDLNANIRKTKTEADGLLRSYSDGNNAKLLDAETTAKLIKLYPDLAGEVTAYATTVDEAAAAVKRLTEAEVINAAEKQVEKLRKQAEAAEEFAAAYEKVKNTGGNPRAFLDDPLIRKGQWDAAVQKAETTRREINAELAKIGKGLGDDFAIVDIPVTLSVDRNSLLPPDGPGDIKKRWQDWFGEITKIDPARFGDSGARAAELYLAEFERSLLAQSAIAEALGDKLDVAGILRSRQSDVQKALNELFAIDPDQIDSAFTLADSSVRRLTEEYRRLGEEAQKLENSLAIEDVLKSLDREVKNLTEDKYDLALATMAAANATEEEMAQAAEMIEILREAAAATDELSLSFEEFLSQKVSGGLMDIFPELEKQAATAIGNISANLAMMSFDGLLDGLGAIGEAFAKGENAADSFKQAMAAMAQQILNQLPTLFLQAGLQLIAQGQWPLGLGFIAAAGSTAIIAGYTKGTIARETEAAKNAHGNVFDSGGAIQFAHGGSFTNQVVTSPTYFRYGGKFGVMGEAGPESIMPLKRMANGDLGVAANGAGGAQVTVNIINNSGAEVGQEEHEDGYGNKEIEVYIGGMVDRHISSGKADRVMAARFGSRPVGV